jgi:hypothetical protein
MVMLQFLVVTMTAGDCAICMAVLLYTRPLVCAGPEQQLMMLDVSAAIRRQQRQWQHNAAGSGSTTQPAAAYLRPPQHVAMRCVVWLEYTAHAGELQSGLAGQAPLSDRS